MRRVWAILAVTAGLGCSPGAEEGGPVRDVEARVSEVVVTVVTVSWTTAESTSAWVEFGETTDYGFVTPPSAGTAHEAVLVGLPADTEAHYRVVAEIDGEPTVFDDHTVTTGSLPNSLPELEVSGVNEGWVVTSVMGTVSAYVIVDGHGRIVWYYLPERHTAIYRAYLSQDGRGVIGSNCNDAAGGIWRVDFDGSAVFDLLGDVRHDFVELPDGTVAALMAETVQVDDEGTMATGDRIVEVSPEGELTTAWSPWSEFSPEEICTEPDCIEDWTHANALDYDPDEDAYYVNLHRVGGIVRVDRATGETNWVVGGAYSSFTFSEGSPDISLSHQFQFSGDRLVVFNNGDLGEPAEVDEFALNMEARTATWLGTYDAGGTVEVSALGDAEFLDDGGVHTAWGTAGVMKHLDAGRNPTWSLGASLGYAFGYATPVRDLYVTDAR